MPRQTDYADKFYEARAAQAAARDRFYATIRRFLERHGDVTDAISMVVKVAGRANCELADLKPLVRSFARTDYAIAADSQFGQLVVAERAPKKRKKVAGDVGNARDVQQSS